MMVWVIQMDTNNIPTLGIFYNGQAVSDKTPNFGLEGHHFQQLARLAPNYGLKVIVFMPHRVDLENRLIQGYTLNRCQEWVFETFPFPNVLYVRGVSSDTAESQERFRLVEHFEKLGIANLNNNAFAELVGNKLLFHMALQKSEVASFLPYTEPWQSSRLPYFLQQFETVFLKPIDGFESRGLIRIQQDLGSYQWILSDSNGILETQSGSLTMLLSTLDRATKNHEYIMQEGIQRTPTSSRFVEHRCLMQRVKNTWYRTTHVLRVNSAQNLPFISAGREKNYLYQTPPFSLEIEEVERFEQNVQQLTDYLSRFFNQSPYYASEFSVDFILDSQQNVRLLECNARPSGFFLQTGDWLGRMSYLSHTLQQAACLVRNIPEPCQ